MKTRYLLTHFQKCLLLLSLFGGLGSLTSCDKDLLEEKPQSVAVETFYNTTNEVESAVYAIYSPLRSTNCLGGLFNYQVETYDDYTYGKGSYAILSEYQSLDATNVTRVQSIWENFYLAIRNANLVIKNTPNGSTLTKADITKYVAEAKFLRGLTYFYLVRGWSGVPIRTETNMLDQNLKRSTADEVYTQILADLKEAEAGLPDKAPQGGRATIWAAKTVLADVYFYQGKYAEARDKAKEVVSSGKFSLVEVTVPDDFYKIFGPDVATTTEEVFHLKFAKQTGLGNNFVWFYQHPNTKLFNTGSPPFGTYSKSDNPFIATWDAADLRKTFNFISIGDFGLGATAILSKKFIDPTAIAFDASSTDYPMYRYADVLLLYAEAISRAGNGPTAEALDALNQVHRRGYGKNSKTASSVDFKLTDYTAQSFADLVVKERAYETMFESKRWYDLKRLGADKLKVTIKAAKGKDVTDKYLLWPLPASELNYNLALDAAKDQNPGY